MDTFRATLYVIADDFSKLRFAEEIRPGRNPSLVRTEVVTLAIHGQGCRFRSQCGFCRFAQRNCARAFEPRLTGRSRTVWCREHATIIAFFLHLSDLLKARQAAYEIMDTSGVLVRNIQNSGLSWLVGDANIGRWICLGWYFAFRGLIWMNRDIVLLA